MSIEKQNFKQQEILDNSKKEQKELSTEKLQTIKNLEFLKIAPKNRLQYITKNNIKSEDLLKKNLRISNIEFTFTFNWEFNKDLYLKTTAWQVLPEEIIEVTSKWIIYKRHWLKGEFFSDEGKRLLIHEGTKIENIKLREIEEINKLKKEINKKKDTFLSENPNLEKFQDIVLEAYSRGIDPNFAIEAFGKYLNKYSIISQERKVLLEDMFTEYDRIKGRLPVTLKNIKQWIQVLLLRKFGGKNWKQKAEKLWILNDTIKQFESREYSVTEFLNKAKEISAKIEEKYGIPRQVVLWQALLESWNWQSKLTKLANNAFGHKARPGQPSIWMMTWEYRNWNYWKKLANFRVFNSLEESFESYAKLLTESSRYKNAFNYKNNPEKFLYEIVKAWYATLSPDRYVANVKARLKRFWESLA